MEKYKSDLVGTICLTVYIICGAIVQEKTQESMQRGKDDEKLQQTVQLTKQRLAMFAKVTHCVH